MLLDSALLNTRTAVSLPWHREESALAYSETHDGYLTVVSLPCCCSYLRMHRLGEILRDSLEFFRVNHLVPLLFDESKWEGQQVGAHCYKRADAQGPAPGAAGSRCVGPCTGSGWKQMRGPAPGTAGSGKVFR